MRRLARAEALLALGIVALGLVALDQTRRIPVSPIYAQVGPTAMAYAASLLLLGLGALLLVEAWRGRWGSAPEAAEAGLDLRSLGWLLLGLVLNVGLIGPLGFIPASVLLFICTARAFGSRRILFDLLIGLAFAALAYFGFAKLLGINIGAGILEGLV